MNDENLRPCTPENARERQKKSVQKRRENTAKRKLMSQIYAEFLAEQFDVKTGGGTKKITGAELVNETMKRIITRGDSASVSMLRELREGTEGNTSKSEIAVAFKKDMESSEERKKLFDSLIGKK